MFSVTPPLKIVTESVLISVRFPYVTAHPKYELEGNISAGTTLYVESSDFSINFTTVALPEARISPEGSMVVNGTVASGLYPAKSPTRRLYDP